MHFWMIHAFLMMLQDHQSRRGGRKKLQKILFIFLVNILDIYFNGNRHSALANISISIETSAKLSIFSRELLVCGDKCSVASLGDM